MQQITRLVNAMIIDMTQEHPPYLGTIKIENGIIIHIEKQGHIYEITEANTVLDVQGQYVIPGMIDTHSHIIMGSVQNPFPSCAGITSIAALIDTMRQILPNTSLTPNGWLKIVGYEAEQFSEQRHPTRHDLDQISSDIPILLEHASFHSVVLNTVALERVGIELTDVDPPQAFYTRDTTGRLTGHICDFYSIPSAKRQSPQLVPEYIAACLNEGVAIYLRAGITELSELNVGGLYGKSEVEGVCQFLATPQRIRSRWTLQADTLNAYPEYRRTTHNDWAIRFRQHSKGMANANGVKFFADGTMALRTAALSSAYADGYQAPDPVITVDEMYRQFVDFQQRGYHLITHAIGDVAIQRTLEAYIATAPYRNTTCRHRIEHLHTVTPKQLQLMAQYDIGGSFFTNQIAATGERLRTELLGQERVQHIFPTETARMLGVCYTLHADTPVTPIEPLHLMHHACERRTSANVQIGAAECLSRYAALAAMTCDAAMLNGATGKQGVIQPGANADLVCLTGNPLDKSVSLLDIGVLRTIVAGKVVYER
ncbi:amidohydrolase [Staphylococcus americanisciuri]|uniref:Amidohydrolase n=1 Tax=Staphylococcus americanisciuri TaxID=2973940 RepID=A0ABT2F146_9STAP|nr:amidohydrolase [Staphylococcus americanisciuri]MCS4486157.1 amidohydrolase [Staphylococcus americanisciuri]